MPKYRVEVDWEGYSRGFSEYIIEADSIEEAKDNFWAGEKVFSETVRDDTEKEAQFAEEIEE